jgi:hypothetical protein
MRKRLKGEKSKMSKKPAKSSKIQPSERWLENPPFSCLNDDYDDFTINSANWDDFDDNPINNDNNDDNNGNYESNLDNNYDNNYTMILIMMICVIIAIIAIINTILIISY